RLRKRAEGEAVLSSAILLDFRFSAAVGGAKARGKNRGATVSVQRDTLGHRLHNVRGLGGARASVSAFVSQRLIRFALQERPFNTAIATVIDPPRFFQPGSMMCGRCRQPL